MSTERPVTLIHSYLTDRTGRNKPDRLTRVGILAACELYRRGKIEKLCVTVEPNLAAGIEKQVKRLLPTMPDEDLIMVPRAVTTRQELQTFGQAAKDHQWGNLLAIANSAHLPRIKRAAQKIFSRGQPQFNTVSAQDLLVSYPRYRNILATMESWPEQYSFARQEEILNKLEEIPLVGDLITGLFPRIFPAKIALQAWIFRQLEKQKR